MALSPDVKLPRQSSGRACFGAVGAMRPLTAVGLSFCQMLSWEPCWEPERVLVNHALLLASEQAYCCSGQQGALYL